MSWSLGLSSFEDFLKNPTMWSTPSQDPLTDLLEVESKGALTYFVIFQFFLLLDHNLAQTLSLYIYIYVYKRILKIGKKNIFFKILWFFIFILIFYEFLKCRSSILPTLTDRGDQSHLPLPLSPALSESVTLAMPHNGELQKSAQAVPEEIG